ncbi:MAG: RibD family protein [Thermoplasmatales archaeon]
MRPYVIINFASSLDGRISAENGKQFKFSNLKDMSRVHKMRAQSDIIIVGRNTVDMDDPKLTINPKYFESDKIPDVGILDSAFRVNALARVFNYRRNVIIFCGSSAPPREFEKKVESKVIVRRSPEKIPTAEFVVKELEDMNYRKVMVEGGMSTITSFILGGVWDEINIFYSPIVIGKEGVPMVGYLQHPISLGEIEVTRLGNGFLVKIKKGLSVH